MSRLLIVLSLLLSGCANVGVSSAFSYGADDYRFLEKEYENLTPLVEFVLMKNEQEFNSERKRALGTKWSTVSAFTFWNEEKGKCTIYIKDPEWKYEPELIGHEVAHCIWGRFHRGKEGLRD